MNRFNSAPLAALLLLAAPLLAAPSAGPEGGGERPPAAQGHDHRRMEHPWVLMGMPAARVTLWRSDLETVPVPYDGHWAFPPPSGVDNYHALAAVEEGRGGTRSVVKYLYRNGKPSGHSPRELLARVKAPLEIVPAPLPREHYRYIEGEAWGFQLRRHGEPVAGAELVLRTFNGSRLVARTDADGVARFELPRDFEDVRPGRRLNRARPFVVSAALEEGNVRHDTTLQAQYQVNPDHWRSAGLGWLAMGGGVLAGLFIGRLGLGAGGRT